MEKLYSSDLVKSTLSCPAKLIDAIGEPHFGRHLLEYLHPLCDTEHCSVFKLDEGRPTPIIAASLTGPSLLNRPSPYLSRFWRSDPLFPEAQAAACSEEPIMLTSGVDSLYNSSVRSLLYGAINIGERNLLCAKVRGSMLTLCVPRPKNKAALPRDAVRDLLGVAQPLFSIIGAHLRITDGQSGTVAALASQRNIEDCIATSGAGLSKRERQVCSWIIFGVSSAGIALELKIGEETVATYRKRAYQRLGIGSKHELLRWHLAQWKHQAHDNAGGIVIN